MVVVVYLITILYVEPGSYVLLLKSWFVGVVKCCPIYLYGDGRMCWELLLPCYLGCF
jgi:hypothetical protein